MYRTLGNYYPEWYSFFVGNEFTDYDAQFFIKEIEVSIFQVVIKYVELLFVLQVEWRDEHSLTRHTPS